MNAKHSTLLVRFSGQCKRFLGILSRKWPQCSQPPRPDVVPTRLIHANCCSSKTLSYLSSRAVVRLAGPDTLNFLQGLVTNDVQQLNKEGVTAQYTMMLNVQGRILYDLFLYDISQDLNNPVLLVEVDRSATEDLIKILKRYRLRKKVDISDASNEFQVWSKFKLSIDTNVSDPTTPTQDDAFIVTLDPRVPSFGKRILRRGNNDEWIRNSVDESVYRQMRYQWGIPEGQTDLPPGNCFPLESNLAFMNGVDFHKGCYIGQELTARTHHTGVTRKRLMPLFLSSPSPSLECDAVIVNEKGRNAGKLRSHQEGYALGLVRLAFVNDRLSIRDGDTVVTQVKTNVPAWWPPLE